MMITVPWTMTFKAVDGSYQASRVQAPSFLTGMTSAQIADIVDVEGVVEIISLVRGDHMSTAVIPAKCEDNEEIIIG